MGDFMPYGVSRAAAILFIVYPTPSRTRCIARPRADGVGLLAK